MRSGVGARIAAGWVTVLGLIGCGGGLPEIRPGLFAKPSKTEDHGRIKSLHYRTHDGPRTIDYQILEVDGTAVRVPGGYVERTSWPADDSLGAVAAQVRGDADKVAGIWILQLDGDSVTFERLCPYQKLLASWSAARFEGCPGVVWDAARKGRASD